MRLSLRDDHLRHGGILNIFKGIGNFRIYVYYDMSMNGITQRISLAAVGVNNKHKMCYTPGSAAKYNINETSIVSFMPG